MLLNIFYFSALQQCGRAFFACDVSLRAFDLVKLNPVRVKRDSIEYLSFE